MQLLALVFLSLISFPVTPLHAAAANLPDSDDRAIIQRRRIILLRTPRLVKQFPHKKRAIVVYPVVSGLRDPEVLRRVKSLLNIKNIFDSSLREYREDAWLDEFNFTVNHNANSLLDITFRQSGSAAYPDDQEKHLLINLKNGRLVGAAEAFRPDKLTALATAVDRKLQQELRQLTSENARDKKSGAEERESLKQAYEDLKFETSHLDDFSVGPKGITFRFDAGFPHVIQAREPSGRYLFTYSELKPYINPNGPLGHFVR